MEKRKPRSLKWHVLRIFLAVCIPTVVLMGVFLYSSMQETRERSAQTVQRSLTTFCGILSSQMDASENVLLNQTRSNEAFRALGDMLEPTDAYLQLLTFRSSLPYILNTNSLLSGIVVYSQSNALCTGVYNRTAGAQSSEQLAHKLELENAFSVLTNSRATNTSGWYLRTIRNRMYLVRTVRFLNAYVNAFFDLELVCGEASDTYGLSGCMTVLDSEGTELLRSNPRNLPISPAVGKNLYTNGGRTIAAAEYPMEGLTFVYEDEVGSLIGSLSPVQIVMAILAAVLLIAIPFLIYYMIKVVFRPMSTLMDTMTRIGTGEVTARPDEEFRDLELIQINATFNQMLDQIIQLRIDSYEQQLEAERSEMTMLKMQIRPHFILNCLKQVYALAETGSVQDIQTMTLLLSQHLRYILSYTKDTIRLVDELDQCRNYASLSGIGLKDPIYFTCYVEPALEAMPLPTVSLLTLVENSVKHGRISGQALRISVTARVLQAEDGDIANLTISDNGSGFSAEELEQMNREDCAEQEGYHIGLSNVIRRLRFQYGNHVAIAFANNRSGGALIELFIPLGHGQEKGLQV